jgi:hypothetical protein
MSEGAWAGTAEQMEQAIRGYFDACNSGVAEAVAAYFTVDATHYFPPGMYAGPFVGGRSIGERWALAVQNFGSRWSVDSFIGDPASGRAVIEWTHRKRTDGVVLRGDEWYLFDRPTGLIREIRAYYASPQAEGLTRLELQGFPYSERGYPLD